MPTPLLVYIAINISMNIMVLVVVKHAGVPFGQSSDPA
jgi:hypothetical protein